MSWDTFRLWIVLFGWPLLAGGGVYILYTAFSFSQKIKQASLGKFIVATNTALVLTMVCLGVVASFFLFLSPSEISVAVVAPIFAVWVFILVRIVFLSQKWSEEAVSLNKEFQLTKQELERRVKKRTKELRLSLANNQALVQSIGEGLIAADTKFRVELVNPRAQDMLGWGSSDLVGNLIGEEAPFIVDESGAQLELKKTPSYAALLSGKKMTLGGASEQTYYYVRKNDTRFPVAITATPIMLGGKAKGVILLFRDITKEKELDRAKSEYISLASHQLRTPPLALKWNAEILLDTIDKKQKKTRKIVEDMEEISEKMLETVGALLNASRIELGTFIVEPIPVDYREIAKSVLAEFAPQIRSKALVVKKAFDKTIPSIPADPALAKIIIQNLVSNAVKYTPKKGGITISIHTRKGAGGIRLSVKDNGVGIPKEAQKHIFQKMFRADNVKDVADGTGFGLYLLKSIVAFAGGKAWFKSKIGDGTTFFVDLPKKGMQKKKGTSRLG